MFVKNALREKVVKYQSYGLSNIHLLPQAVQWNPSLLMEMKVVGSVLPFKTNNYVAGELINWENVPDDPMFRLTFPQREMLQESHYKIMAEAIARGSAPGIISHLADKIRHQLNPHPAGQKDLNVPEIHGMKLPGMQHKYRQTLLFFPSQGQTCHAYCTFCFRWPQFTGMDEMKFAMREGDLLVDYLNLHPEVTDVLFTGGDPLIMRTRVLQSYISKLLDPHNGNLQTIRIGTKAFGYWPYRFTRDEDADDLLRLFERVVKSGINLAIMAHFNHPVELSTRAARHAVKRVLSTGAQIRTQSPILRHINDNAATWSKMWREQVNLNCIPYYMFIPRDTGAHHYFSVPLVETWDIFRKAYQGVSGVCRTVRGPSMSCTPGKIQVLGVSDVQLPAGSEKVITLRFLQGRNPDWVARPFFAKYDPNACWIDELRPAFGAGRFFFEEELSRAFQEKLISEDTIRFE